MIVTFTANPSVDRTAEVDAIVRGAVLRARSVRLDGGGKGVNVTRALTAHGHRSVAVLPNGGAEGAQLLALLAAEGLEVRTVPVTGAVRANVTIVEPDGTTTKINEPGPALAPAEVDSLVDALLGVAAGSEWVVLSGSLPPGARDLYASLTRRLRLTGARVAVDTDGPLLRAALAGQPDLVKPNQRELAEASGVPVRGPDDALVAIDRLLEAGARGVLASLGPAGAVLVDDSGAHSATAPVATRRSTVGAGDALLAGFLAAGGKGPAALAEAVAWGTAAVSLPGSGMPVPANIDRSAVRVRSLEPRQVPDAHARHL